MGVLELIWDLDQDGKIRTQQEMIEHLNAKVENLEKWVMYLNERLEKLDDQRPQP